MAQPKITTNKPVCYSLNLNRLFCCLLATLPDGLLSPTVPEVPQTTSCIPKEAMGRPRRACRGPKGKESVASETGSLLQLPDPLLLAVLQFCADDPSSVCSAAIAHSRLHQAAMLALTSIKADVDNEEQLESLLLYLEKHGQHVDSITITGDFDPRAYGESHRVTLQEFPAGLQLHSLECNNMEIVQRYPDEGFRMVLDPEAPLKRLLLKECCLNGRIYMSQEIVGALSRLTTLEHLSIVNCMSDTLDYDVCVVACADGLFEELQQLTYLELSDVFLHHREEYNMPAEPNLQALTRLVDLRLGSFTDDVCSSVASADMLSGLTRLTRLDLKGFEGVDAGVLAGKTLLQHLDLSHNTTDDGPDAAELLSMLQPLQQLTHLNLDGSWAEFEEGSAPTAAAFSALTASTKLQYLRMHGCMVPSGVWQHMFPAGRRLPHLRSLDLSHATATSGGKAMAPEGSCIVRCCPTLESLHIYGLEHYTKSLAPLGKRKGLHVYK